MAELDKLLSKVNQLNSTNQSVQPPVKQDKIVDQQANKQTLAKYGVDKDEDENPWWITLPFGKWVKQRRDKKLKIVLDKRFKDQFNNELTKTEKLLMQCRELGLTSPAQWSANNLDVQKQIELLYVAAVNLSSLEIKKMKSEHKIGVQKDGM